MADLRRDVYEALKEIAVEMDDAQSLSVVMDVVPDVASGLFTFEAGFQIKNGAGEDVPGVRKLTIALFDAPALLSPSGTATVTAVSAGTSHVPLPGSTLIIDTDANGKFTMTCSAPLRAPLYIATNDWYGSPSLNKTDVAIVNFLP